MSAACAPPSQCVCAAHVLLYNLYNNRPCTCLKHTPPLVAHTPHLHRTHLLLRWSCRCRPSVRSRSSIACHTHASTARTCCSAGAFASSSRTLALRHQSRPRHKATRTHDAAPRALSTGCGTDPDRATKQPVLTMLCRALCPCAAPDTRNIYSHADQSALASHSIRSLRPRTFQRVRAMRV